MIRKFFSRIGMALSCLLGVLGLVTVGLYNHYRRRYDSKASAAEDEARKVKEAGKRGDADEVLNSFRRATRK